MERVLDREIASVPLNLTSESNSDLVDGKMKKNLWWHNSVIPFWRERKREREHESGGKM